MRLLKLCLFSGFLCQVVFSQSILKESQNLVERLRKTRGLNSERAIQKKITNETKKLKKLVKMIKRPTEVKSINGVIEDIGASLGASLENDFPEVKKVFDADLSDRDPKEEKNKDVEQKEDQITESSGAIDSVDEGAVNRLIGGLNPMIAVLFSPSLSRNQYELTKDLGMANTKFKEGTNKTANANRMVNQAGSGETAGLLVAGETPFFSLKRNGNRYPVGGWLGVQFQTGDGSDISTVDFSTGLSFTFLSAGSLERAKQGSTPVVPKSVRLLLGAVYGEHVTLGEGVNENTTFNLGDTIPLQKERKLEFTFGLGFRF